MHQVALGDVSWSGRVPRDEELVFRARRGRSSAVDELLRRYRGLVESKARLFYLAGADHEDVVQEGMIGLFKAVRDFSCGEARVFRSFADLCVTRQIITAVKAASRHKHVALNSYVSVHAPATPTDPEQCLIDVLAERHDPRPEDVVAHRELCARISGRVDHELSELEGRALRLYLQGRSYGEIAGTLQVKVKQIDNALQRAKRKITRDLWPEIRRPAGVAQG